jgi:hypothetical protein
MRHPNASGIVVAGFGDDETFPSVVSLAVEGIANSILKYRIEEERCDSITLDSGSCIIPFAQQEMVVTFMEGVDPQYQQAMEMDLARIFAAYTKDVVESIDKLDKEEKKELLQKLKVVRIDILKRYREKLEEYRSSAYAQPIVSVVSVIPKSELATLAESLVHLTSLKRKVSMSAETVGGPIDVAVISKGDGLVWIKRKHYFSAELNNQFFANYYRSDL